MLRDGGNILLIRADDQQYLPYGKCAALDTGLPAGGGVTEINEGEFRTSEPFLNQTCAGIAWRPAMASCHAFKTISALSGQAHTDDDGPSWAHEFLPKECNYRKHCSTCVVCGNVIPEAHRNQ